VDPPSQELAVVIVSYQSREYLERALEAWSSTGHEPLVVDNASTDGSAHAARSSGARVLALSENMGYGAAANAGIAATAPAPYVLVVNPDAWPAGPDDADALLERLRQDDKLGAVGPCFVGIDGDEQPTLLPQASRWWTGSHAVTSFPGPRTPLARLRARSRPQFLVGAAILLRRAAIDDVGAFDPTFFLYHEEVDLCRRLVDGGWGLDVAADATFVHVGGVSTRPRWDAAYRELLRGHLRILDRYDGPEAADHARKLLATSLSVRARVGSQEQRRFLQGHANWLRAASVEEILERGADDRLG
jgi:N-acetylglucosaminyl-diphospho-decaprenol L-rhamnosyltransferase